MANKEKAKALKSEIKATKKEINKQKQALKDLKCLELALQAFLLVAQAGRPMPICDNQQQRTVTPRCYMAVLAGRRLQLAFQQALQVAKALGMAEDGF